MKAIVFRGIGNIQIEDVPEPKLQGPFDAIVRITASAICGTDLHIIRGTMGEMEPGTILGHEGVGIVEEVGTQVRNLSPGDRVVIPATIGCGYCSYCRAGYFSQCDNANPLGRDAGTAMFGGPKSSGPINGLQAEYARIPFANAGLVKLPEDITDDEALLLSDIFPTGYFGASLAEIRHGDTVAVFGCGPVGLFAIAGAFMFGAGRVIAVDKLADRLEMAKDWGAEVIDFEREDPVKTIKDLTGGIGVDRAIDAVGIDALLPEHGPALSRETQSEKQEFERELNKISPAHTLHPGNAPSIVTRWAVQSMAKAGTLAIIGMYPPGFDSFPIGEAMNRNLTINMGSCNHRKYIPLLIEAIESGAAAPEQVITQVEPLESALDAYRAFEEHRPGWIKVELVPAEELSRV